MRTHILQNREIGVVIRSTCGGGQEASVSDWLTDRVNMSKPKVWASEDCPPRRRSYTFSNRYISLGWYIVLVFFSHSSECAGWQKIISHLNTNHIKLLMNLNTNNKLISILTKNDNHKINKNFFNCYKWKITI